MDASPQSSLARKMWGSSLLVGLGIYIFFVFYIFLYDQGFSFSSFVKTFAGTANFLFALSLSLSAFGYFFNFLDSKVAYRKYFGLLGYFSALTYMLLVPVVNPERYFYGFFNNFWSSDIILGLLSMGIFTVMALISNNTAMLWIGPKRWRFLLRFGYLAFFLLVLRAILNQDIAIGADRVPEMWALYLASPENVPPPRLLFSVVAMAVLFFRFSVDFDKWQRPKASGDAAISSPGAPPSSFPQSETPANQ